MKSVFLPFLVINLVSCQLVESRSYSKDSTINPSPEFTPIISKGPLSEQFCPNSKVGDDCMMTWKDALTYCASQDQHLPTAREYIAIAQPLGTKILETKDVTAGTAPIGYYLVDCLNPDEISDAFYASNTNYKKPSGQTKFHRLWTASQPPEHLQFAHVYYDDLGGGGGTPAEHQINVLNAVQCVRN